MRDIKLRMPVLLTAQMEDTEVMDVCGCGLEYRLAGRDVTRGTGSILSRS